MTDYEINKAAEEFTDQFVPENKKHCNKHSKYCGTPSSLEDVYGAFTEGAEWALNHQWISVDNSLPKYNETVLVTNDCENYWFGHRSNSTIVLRDKYNFATDYSGNNITYWMPIPKFDKKFEK